MGKKGGAKNKLAKMSDEERARYLQHRADMEEEARRRKQQLICLYMKNKLKREEAFCRLNLAKINQEWRSILRQIKCQELKNEIGEVERLFEESFEQKNRIIRRLLADLDEAEDLYATLQQSHMEDVERLISIQQQRMKFWRKAYISEKEAILQECQEDFAKYKVGRDGSQLELECVFYGLEASALKRSTAHDEDHVRKSDDLRSSMAIKLEEITKTREDQLEKLWRDYQQVLDDYVKYTDNFYAEYSELRERDEENTKLIRAHCYEVARSTDHIAELKLEAETAAEEHDFQVNYLQRYRTDLNKRFLDLKKNLEETLKNDRDQFKYMVVNSHSAIKFLEKHAKKGESLMQIVAACRKLETEREKVLPFGLTKSKLFERSVAELKEPPDQFKESTIGMWFNLENFWLRVNNVRLDNACLIEEKTSLERENAALKSQLKRYLTQITLDSGNTELAQKRLLYRPSSMKVEKVIHIDLNGDDQYPPTRRKAKRRPVTCIEANLSNAVRVAKLTENKMNTVKMRTLVNW